MSLKFEAVEEIVQQVHKSLRPLKPRQRVDFLGSMLCAAAITANIGPDELRERFEGYIYGTSLMCDLMFGQDGEAKS